MARATFCFYAVACEGWVGNCVVIEGEWCRKGRWGEEIVSHMRKLGLVREGMLLLAPVGCL